MKLRTSRSSTERGALNRWDDEGGAPVGPVRSRSGKAQEDRSADKHNQGSSKKPLEEIRLKNHSTGQSKA